MTARRLLLAALFCAVFLIGLFAFAPASLMGYALARASGGTLSLARTTGSLWQGTGVALLTNKSRQQTLGNYRWKLHPFDASMQLWTGASAPTTVRYLPLSNRVDIDQLHITLPASTIELVAPQLGPYQLQGMFEARSEQLSLDAGGMNGQVSVDWMNAASALSAIRPLGDYRIVLQGKRGGVDAQLSTLSGKLLLNGTGSFDPRNGMQLNGTAQAAPGNAATELNELLHHIGPEIRPGVFTLALMPQPGVR